MKKTKILFMLLLAALFLSGSKAEAKTEDWVNIFATGQENSTKNNKDIEDALEDEIKEELDKIFDKKGRLKIDGKYLKDETIGADKVGNDVAKRKVYTGTMPTSESGGDKTTEDGTHTYYWKKISIPEIVISDTPQVMIYEKITNKTSIAPVLWQIDTNFYMEDGAIYESYGDRDSSDDEWTQFVGDYKIVVNY